MHRNHSRCMCGVRVRCREVERGRDRQHHQCRDRQHAHSHGETSHGGCPLAPPPDRHGLR